MTLNELCQLSHQRAKDAGWWDPGKEKTPIECHMLMVSEIAEATEEVRKRKADFYLIGSAGTLEAISATGEDIANVLSLEPTGKPEGEAVELADAVIRIADYYGRKGWDLEAVVKAKMDYNLTRGYRHGGKAA